MNNYLNEIQSKGYLILNQNDLIKDELLKKNISEIFHNVKLKKQFDRARINHNVVKINDNFEFEKHKQDQLKNDKFFQIWKYAHIENIDYPIIKKYLQKIVKKIYEVDIEEHSTEYTCFEKGCSIVPHIDKNYTSKNRICVILSYFNDNWKEEYGGCLVINNKEVVIPNQGTIVVLDFTKNNVLHEVTEVVEDKNRFCLTTFVDYKNYNDN